MKLDRNKISKLKLNFDQICIYRTNNEICELFVAY